MADASLNVRMVADTSQLKAGLAEATRAAEQFSAKGKQIAQAGASMGNGLKQVGTAATGLKGKLGGFASEMAYFADELSAGIGPVDALASRIPLLVRGLGSIASPMNLAVLAVSLLGPKLVQMGVEALSSSEKVKTLKEASGEIKTSFGEMGEASKSLQAELVKLAQQSVDTGAAVRRSLVGDIRLAKAEALGQTQDLLVGLGNEFKQFQGTFQDTSAVLKQMKPNVMLAVDGFKQFRGQVVATTPAAKALLDQLAGYKQLGATASELEGIARATQRVNEAARSGDVAKQAAAFTDLKNRTQELLERLGVAPGIISAIVGPLDAAASSARNLAGAVDVARVAMNNFLVVFAKYQSAGTAMPSSYGFNFTPTIQGIETTTSKMERMGVVQKQVQTEMAAFWNTANVEAQGQARQIVQQNIPAIDQLKAKVASLKQAKLTLGTNATTEELRVLDLAITETEKDMAKLASTSNGVGSGGGGGSKGGGGGGASGAIKKVGDAAKKAGQDLKSATAPMQEFSEGLKSIAENALNGVVDALFAVAEGSKSMKEAMTDMIKSLLKQLASLLVQLLIIKPLMGAIFPGAGAMGAGGGGIGLFSQSVGRSIGSSRTSQAVGNYTGFNLQPGITAMRSSMASSIGNQNMPRVEPVQVNITNNSSAQVRQRRDGNVVTVEMFDEMLHENISRGGSKADVAFQRAYGARRQGY
jgi:hypothetical protein